MSNPADPTPPPIIHLPEDHEVQTYGHASSREYTPEEREAALREVQQDVIRQIEENIDREFIETVEGLEGFVEWGQTSTTPLTRQDLQEAFDQIANRPLRPDNTFLYPYQWQTSTSSSSNVLQVEEVRVRRETRLVEPPPRPRHPFARVNPKRTPRQTELTPSERIYDFTEGAYTSNPTDTLTGWACWEEVSMGVQVGTPNANRDLFRQELLGSFVAVESRVLDEADIRPKSIGQLSNWTPTDESVPELQPLDVGSLTLKPRKVTFPLFDIADQPELCLTEIAERQFSLLEHNYITYDLGDTSNPFQDWIDKKRGQQTCFQSLTDGLGSAYFREDGLSYRWDGKKFNPPRNTTGDTERCQQIKQRATELTDIFWATVQTENLMRQHLLGTLMGLLMRRMETLDSTLRSWQAQLEEAMF